MTSLVYLIVSPPEATDEAVDTATLLIQEQQTSKKHLQLHWNDTHLRERGSEGGNKGERDGEREGGREGERKGGREGEREERKEGVRGRYISSVCICPLITGVLDIRGSCLLLLLRCISPTPPPPL